MNFKECLPAIIATVLCWILFYFEVGSPNPAGVDGKAIWAGIGFMGLLGIVANTPFWFSGISCKIGRHKFNKKFVGLLYRNCDRCGKNIQVCDKYSYRPSLGE